VIRLLWRRSLRGYGKGPSWSTLAGEDPPHLARDAGSAEEALECYRRVRDEIRAFVETLPEALESS